MLKIGIAVPTYNRPELLIKTLESIKNQDYGNWITVVVDDNSTIDYSDVKKMFSSDGRFIFKRNDRNFGANFSLNRAFDQLLEYNADYITFLDDDDIFSKDYFSKGIEIIKNNSGYGWYMSNNYGEHKKSTCDILKEREFDWIDDYIYGKFRGDKAHLISRDVLDGIRIDERFRASHRWPFFVDLCEKTKIFAFPHDSIKKTYLEGGITKGNRKKIKSFLDIHNKFYKHYYVIKKRPLKFKAYKYFFLELFKSPPRYLRLFLGK